MEIGDIFGLVLGWVSLEWAETKDIVFIDLVPTIFTLNTARAGPKMAAIVAQQYHPCGCFLL